MTSIYDAAVRNYRAAADMLEALQATRLDLVDQARNGLIGRPRLGLSGGYNDVTPVFGACLPASARADLMLTEDTNGIELRCNGADWMTLEGTLPLQFPADRCYLEMQVSADRPVVIDVFLREFLAGGEVRDGGHRECHLITGSVTVCALNMPDLDADIDGRRLIVHLRYPAQRMILDRLAVTLT